MGDNTHKIFEYGMAVFFFCAGIFVVFFSFYIFRFVDFKMKNYRESGTTVVTQVDIGMSEEKISGESVCEQILSMNKTIVIDGERKPLPLYVGSQNMNARYSSGESVLERIRQGDYELLYAIVSKTAMYQVEYAMDKNGNMIGVKYLKKG